MTETLETQTKIIRPLPTPKIDLTSHYTLRSEQYKAKFATYEALNKLRKNWEREEQARWRRK